MKNKEIRKYIKTIYEMLWNVLALYEKSERYTVMPGGKKGIDVWDYISDGMVEIRRAVDTLFLGEKKLRETLTNIVDETEIFVRSCEIPGVVTRWKQINPRIIFFDSACDLKEESPKLYQQMSLGLSNLKLSCYPDESFSEARKSYFEDAKEWCKEHNLKYSNELVFQKELIRTLSMVFENDFKEYL